MLSLFTRIFLTTTLFLNFGLSNATHSKNVKDSLKITSISYLRDSPSYTLENILKLQSSNKFTPIRNHYFNFGRTQDKFWLHININAIGSHFPILKIDNPHIYNVFIYKKDHNSLQLLHHVGSDLKFSDRPVTYRNFILPLDTLTDNSAQYFILLDRKNEVLKFSVELADKKNIISNINLDYWLIGIFTGVILFILLFNTFLWISLKDKIHPWYILYLSLLLIFIWADLGIGYEFIWNDMPELNKNIRNPIGMLAFASQLHLMQLFINQTKVNSQFFSLINFNKILLITLSLLVVFSLYYKIQLKDYQFRIFQISFYLAYIGGLILVLLALFEKILQRNKSALIYMIAILPLIGQIIYIILIRWNLIANPINTSSTLAICLLMEVIVITIGLTIRYNNYKSNYNKLEINLINQKNLTLNKVLIAIEDEKKRIAEDLHDEIGGTLSVVKGIISNIDNNSTHEVKEKLLHSQQLLDNICTDLRYITHDLMPSNFINNSLENALEETIKKANLATSNLHFTFLKEGDVIAMDKRVELNIFRIVNELIHNIKKHANATQAIIQLNYHQNFLQLMVEDNGKGILSDNNLNHGIGFKNLKSRAEYINAEIHIDSGQSGTTIICNIPYHEKLG